MQNEQSKLKQLWKKQNWKYKTWLKCAKISENIIERANSHNVLSRTWKKHFCYGTAEHKCLFIK